MLNIIHQLQASRGFLRFGSFFFGGGGVEGCPPPPSVIFPTNFARRTLSAAAAIGDQRFHHIYIIIYIHIIMYIASIIIYIYICIYVYAQAVCNIILDRLPCWTAGTAILFADLYRITNWFFVFVLFNE